MKEEGKTKSGRAIILRSLYPNSQSLLCSSRLHRNNQRYESIIHACYKNKETKKASFELEILH